MRNTFFTFLVLFLSGCSVLKTEQARTDDASSRSTSRFLNKLRSVHGNTLVISCYKGPDTNKLVPARKQNSIESTPQNGIKIPGLGSIFNILGKIVDHRILLQESRMVMGPTGDLTGVRFRRYSGMVDRMKYMEDIDENAAFYAYMEPYPSRKGMGYPRIAIVKIVNNGISIIKVKEDEWYNKPARYQQLKKTMVTPYSDYWLNKNPNHYDKYDFEQMLRLTRSHLLSRMHRLDLNVKPDWIFLLKNNYYAAMFNDRDMPAFYSNF